MKVRVSGGRGARPSRCPGKRRVCARTHTCSYSAHVHAVAAGNARFGRRTKRERHAGVDRASQGRRTRVRARAVCAHARTAADGCR